MKQFVIVGALVGVAIVGGVHCEEPIGPTMCIKRASELGAEAPTCPAEATTPRIRSGEAFVVVHRLPDGVDPSGLELTVKVETPCATLEAKPGYVGPAAVALFIAPPGADCALIVTGTVSDEPFRLSAPAPEDAASCLSLDQACKESDETGESTERDAGDDDAAAPDGAVESDADAAGQ